MNAISRLFFQGCPATIAGFVIAVVFNAIKGLVDRALTHVGKEVRKSQPPFAYSNSTISVVFPSRVFRVGTSTDHVLPRSVGTRSLSVNYMAVGFWFASLMLGTVCDASAFEIGGAGNRLVSAVANAYPTRASELIDVRKGDSNELTETLTTEVKAGWHV
jgi:hypothetical protein